MNSLFYNVLGYVWQYVSNPKAIMAISGFVALMAMYNVIPAKIFWLLIICYVFGLMLWGIYLLIVRRRHAAQGEALADAIAHDTHAEYGKQKNKDEIHLIQQQMKESIQLIRKSKLGDKKGNAALYELPWYMVIGNPAAGKSSAIYNSGLKFPFEETHQKSVSAGLSGTRHCDWFFSTEGVLLDTAGRYSVYAEDHFEKQEMEAYHKSVSSVLSTIGSLEAVKEMTKQQVPVPIWNKVRSKKKLTSDEITQVPLSKLLEMTNIFVKISDAQLKAISKVVDVEGINKAKKEAKEKFKSYNSQNSIQQIDFEAINNDEIVLNEENIEVINDIEEENLDKPVTKDKVKDYLSRILN